MENLIEIRNLTFGYDKMPILEDVSMDVGERDFVLIIGPNGGGKTTLLKIILGIIKPWKGTIRFRRDLAGQIGYVPQFMNFNRDFPINVFDTVLLGRLNRGNYYRKYTTEDREKTASILEEVDLYGKRKERINNLSGGQLQRVLIARALVAHPQVLLLDEPMASIDVTSQATLMDIINDLKEEISIMLVTHDPTAFAPYYQHIACLNRQLYHHGKGELDGKIIEQIYGCPVDLLGHGIPHTMLKKH